METTNAEATATEIVSPQTEDTNPASRPVYSVFKDGKNLHGKPIKPQIIENYTKYYKVYSILNRLYLFFTTFFSAASV